MSVPPEASLRTLWSAAIEAFVHQVLFVRRVYSRDTFTYTRFLGIQCRASRHPEIVDYISKTVEIAVPALMAGTAKELSVVLFDQESNQDIEKYSLDFDKGGPTAELDPREMERELRDLILSVHTLGGLKVPKWPQETTFRVMLLLVEEAAPSSALNEAMTDGKWYCPHSGEDIRSSEKRRPVHQMVGAGCRFYMSKSK